MCETIIGKKIILSHLFRHLFDIFKWHIWNNNGEKDNSKLYKGKKEKKCIGCNFQTLIFITYVIDIEHILWAL